MTHRSKQPSILPVEHIAFVKPTLFDVTEKVKLLWMKNVSNDTVRLDLFFDAGITCEQQSIPSIVHSLLFSGTATLSSVEIHEKIDAYGGFLDTDISFETSVVSIYCLREHILPIAGIVADAINGLTFRENEVDDTLRSMKQQYLVNQQKVKSVAQQQFRKKMFASSEAYAHVADVSHFEQAEFKSYKKFWKEHYLQGMTRMTLVGNLETDTVDALIDLFGKWSKEDKPTFEGDFVPEIGRFDFPKADALQTAIRMGRFLFKKDHPDYAEFQVLNTILGDYFGSRLMSNIREDKGYTYGIGTAFLELHESGYFVVVTEVGKEVCENTLNEIKHEFVRLQTELVGEDELELVKNYMLGQILKSADGPYAMLDLYNSVDMYGLTLDFYDNAIAKVRAITAERIQELAKRYLNWDDFLIITAG